ncbi:hypothetical protein K6485_12755 [Escherichia ruysiae]|nr:MULTISPECIES: hypothetical protein [Escherichia]PSZ19315.1 hypothetical protein C7B04_05620 [Escherichia sp. 4726-5]EFC1525308.1 hypothetical protein [Escherichia coli]EFC9525812.1 hypothetical protein [Escherichia coli]EFE0632816.1 hypothetical protein [Escherichia coli]EFH7840417.1 hypothetical protein [Escherichia coli]
MNSAPFGNNLKPTVMPVLLKAEGGKPSALATFPQLFNKLADQFQQRDQRLKNDENFIEKSFHPLLP